AGAGRPLRGIVPNSPLRQGAMWWRGTCAGLPARRVLLCSCSIPATDQIAPFTVIIAGGELPKAQMKSGEYPYRLESKEMADTIYLFRTVRRLRLMIASRNARR